MRYLLINIEFNKGFYCDDQLWVQTIKIGKEKGWEPEGTIYDRSFVLDECLDEIDGDHDKLFSFVIINYENNEWNGNYLKKVIKLCLIQMLIFYLNQLKIQILRKILLNSFV